MDRPNARSTWADTLADDALRVPSTMLQLGTLYAVNQYPFISWLVSECTRRHVENESDKMRLVRKVSCELFRSKNFVLGATSQSLSWFQPWYCVLRWMTCCILRVVSAFLICNEMTILVMIRLWTSASWWIFIWHRWQQSIDSFSFLRDCHDV